MRPIDADEVLDEICRDQCKRKYKDCDGTCEIAAYVANAPTIGDWISVKERMPKNELVLVSVVTKSTGHRWETPTIGESVHGKWFLETWGTIADNVGVTVTHWMPMPKLPKEEDT